MSTVFADTSGLFASLVSDDRFHTRAAACFASLRRKETLLLTTSYVLVETYALLTVRQGKAAARAMRSEIEPLMRILWVDGDLHALGLDLWLASERRLSLVDAVSFVVMRREHIHQAWSYDSDFESAGFTLLP